MSKPLRVAFTSCMSAYHYPSQPVWKAIQDSRPNHLVLLGDSIYDDVPIELGLHPKDMDAESFRKHLHRRWQTQLAVPEFNALLKAVPAQAIWDDHDFLWDESYGEGAIRQPRFEEHIRTSRALFRAFQRALDLRLAPGSFPAAFDDPVLVQPNEPPPGYRRVSLAPDVMLHLTDGRSWRYRKTLLGADQRAQIEQAMQGAPDAVHLLASGSRALTDKGDRWPAFDDWVWLENLALQYRVLVLSGDIHSNDFDSLDLGLGRWMHEATASGAAMKSMVVWGSERRNHGLLNITDDHVDVTLYGFGKAEPGKSHRIVRSSWTASRTN